MQVVTLPKIQGIKRVAVVTYCKNDWIVWSDPDSDPDSRVVPIFSRIQNLNYRHQFERMINLET